MWRRKEGVQYYAPLPREEKGLEAHQDQERRHRCPLLIDLCTCLFIPKSAVFIRSLYVHI